MKMLINREKRIKYLGFDDTWFVVIGIIILSFITDYLFSNSFMNYELIEALINWSISLFFCMVNWFFMRAVLIYLRIKFPALRDNLKRIGLAFLLIIASVIAIDFLGNQLLAYMYGVDYHPVSRAKILVPIVLISVMIQAIYEAIYYYIKLNKAIRDEEQSKQLIVQAQLDALRNQAQPHFFFNTLNTLRDIIDQNSKEEAKNFVDKISDVYRFILESGNDDLISIKEEINFARSYMHIQKERFGDNLRMNWNISESSLDALVVPMSLQLLLENAIKHNVISKAKPLIVNVTIQDGQLTVENKIQPKTSKLPSTKLGLKNIERRYELISDRSIQFNKSGGQFVVSIPLLQQLNQNKKYASTDS